MIPENEQWLHEEEASADLKRAIDWAIKHPIPNAFLNCNYPDCGCTCACLGLLEDSKGG